MENNFYLAWSPEAQVQKAASSGGAVSALLRFALENGLVDGVVAVKKRNNSRLDAVPCLITDPELINETAGAFHFAPLNMVKIITDYLDGAVDIKLAVTCKPCDVRALVELSKRNQVRRENLFLVGLNCSGTFQPALAGQMIREAFGKNPQDVTGEEVENEKLIITFKDGSTKEKGLEELARLGFEMRENCLRCSCRIARMADIACGKWGSPDKDTTFIEICSSKGHEFLDAATKGNALMAEAAASGQIEERNQKESAAVEKAQAWGKKDLEALKAYSAEQRLKYWVGHLDRCIKCYGCRDACPICFCRECYLEPYRNCVAGGQTPPDIMFPLIRLLHVADSCVNCGQCQDACPMEIPLTRLYNFLNTELFDIFDYKPGLDPDAPPPLTIVTDRELAIDAPYIIDKNSGAR
jgi:formate dehydrogenase subunit beta